MRSIANLVAVASVALLASGCGNLWLSKDQSSEPSAQPVERASESSSSNTRGYFTNPWICGLAGALIAGGVGSIENKEAGAVGALIGGVIGWWACSSEEKPLADADGDGVPDKVDMCVDTKPGAQVSSNGCPVDADTDGDGVPDSLDKCAATVKGSTVNAEGCVPTSDADGDGVPDGNDLCPNTPTGSPVLPNGCEIDSDTDGVPDARDRCPATPAGVKVGTDGCPADADGDGVPDISDRCPNTPAGAKVDQNGCEAASSSTAPGTGTSAGSTPQKPSEADMAIPTAPGESMVLTGVNFESGSARIVRSSYPTLDRLATQLKTLQSGKVEIAGFTDNSGNAGANLGLSQRRADMVRAYLVSKGVPSSLLVARGYGADQPIAPNDTADGRAKNRRVELRVMQEK